MSLYNNPTYKRILEEELAAAKQRLDEQGKISRQIRPLSNKLLNSIKTDLKAIYGFNVIRKSTSKKYAVPDSPKEFMQKLPALFKGEPHAKLLNSKYIFFIREMDNKNFKQSYDIFVIPKNKVPKEFFGTFKNPITIVNGVDVYEYDNLETINDLNNTATDVGKNAAADATTNGTGSNSNGADNQELEDRHELDYTAEWTPFRIKIFRDFLNSPGLIKLYGKESSYEIPKGDIGVTDQLKNVYDQLRKDRDDKKKPFDGDYQSEINMDFHSVVYDGLVYDGRNRVTLTPENVTLLNFVGDPETDRMGENKMIKLTDILNEQSETRYKFTDIDKKNNVTDTVYKTWDKLTDQQKAKYDDITDWIDQHHSYIMYTKIKSAADIAMDKEKAKKDSEAKAKKEKEAAAETKANEATFKKLLLNQYWVLAKAFVWNEYAFWKHSSGTTWMMDEKLPYANGKKGPMPLNQTHEEMFKEYTYSWWQNDDDTGAMNYWRKRTKLALDYINKRGIDKIEKSYPNLANPYRQNPWFTPIQKWIEAIDRSGRADYQVDCRVNIMANTYIKDINNKYYGEAAKAVVEGELDQL
jgi:hypothetical protein